MTGVDEIKYAWYCVDCDRTFPLSEDGDRCPTCGSRRVIDWAEDRHPVNRLDLLLDQMREALEGMVAQYAGWSPDGPGLSADGIGALQCAFEALGWNDPHPYPAQCCDEPGCRERANCGWPSPTGYRRTCGKHTEANPMEAS